MITVVSTSDELMSAFKSSVGGDVIRIKGGRYDTTPLGAVKISAEAVTFVGEGPDPPIIQGERFIFSGAKLILENIALRSGKPVTNFFQILGEEARLIGVDVGGIPRITEKSRAVVVGRRAHRARIEECRFHDVDCLTLVIDEDRVTGETAKDVHITQSKFDRCSHYFFQAGQWGTNHTISSRLIFKENQITESGGGQLKISGCEVLDNYFVRCERGINLRLGDNNKLIGNIYQDTRRPLRIFGGRHRIEQNIFTRSNQYAIAIAEGSLQEQYAVHPNAQHVVAHDITITRNYFVAPAHAPIYVGHPQTGKQGLDHPEPYSPYNIWSGQNILRGSPGRAPNMYYSRPPTTLPHPGDKYPESPYSQTYVGVFLE